MLLKNIFKKWGNCFYLNCFVCQIKLNFSNQVGFGNIWKMTMNIVALGLHKVVINKNNKKYSNLIGFEYKYWCLIIWYQKIIREQIQFVRTYFTPKLKTSCSTRNLFFLLLLPWHKYHSTLLFLYLYVIYNFNLIFYYGIPC